MILFFRLNTDEKNCREEPKCIVFFLSKLLLLFQFCQICSHPNPSITTTQSGTMIIVETRCKSCLESNVWTSQPLLGKFPAGNLLLSFGILCAGASVKKVLLSLKHINVFVYNECTYYYHKKKC